MVHDVAHRRHGTSRAGERGLCRVREVRNAYYTRGKRCAIELAKMHEYCTVDSWKMVHLVVGLRMEFDGSGSLLRHRRMRVLVLKFDVVSKVVLPRFDSVNGNGLSYVKLIWRSEKLMISDGAVSSSGEEVICLFFTWWLLRWCRRKWIAVGLSHRFTVSFQICKIDAYVLGISYFICQ